MRSSQRSITIDSFSLLSMDKQPKKTPVINTIKNKQARERLWQQIKHKKKLEKKERSTKKQKARVEYGEEAIPIEVGSSSFAI